MTTDLATLDQAAATIACGDRTHRIRWAGGDLIADDHPETEGELALSALGGTDVPCLQVITAWRRHRHDHRLLSALTRGPGDPVRGDGPSPTAPRPARRRAAGPLLAQRGRTTGFYVPMPGTVMPLSAGPVASASVVSSTVASGSWATLGSGPGPDGAQGDREELEALVRLGGAIPWRLAATVTTGLLDSSLAAARPALVASLFGRARNALSHWYGDPDLDLELDVIEPGERPGLEAGPDRGFRAALPLSWVADVWGRGLAVTAEGFALSLTPTGPSAVQVETISLDLQTHRLVEIVTR